MKREPSLADLLLAANRNDVTANRKWYDTTLNQLRVAKRFALDAEAAGYVGEMLRRHPRIVADAQDFAIQPFEHMWIEFPYRPFHRALLEEEPDATSDRMVGYLFSGPTVKVGSYGYAAGQYKAGWMPLEHLLHQPLDHEQELRLAEQLGISRIGLDFWYWGESVRHLIGFGGSEETEWDKAGLRALRANHGTRLVPLSVRQMEDKIYPVLAHGSGGNVRNIIALLLFLNRTADIRYEESLPMARAIINRKPSPLLPYRVIKLKLDPRPRLQKLCAGPGIKRRLHDVRGHFCHDRTARAGCPHGAEHEGDFGEWWQEYDVLKWRCTHCDGRRWWKREHKRGEPKMGGVAQQYAVTK